MLRAPEPLTAQHALGSFDSGVLSLDDWLRRRAMQNQASGASRTFVACDDARVAGYYALAASAVAPDAATGRFRRNMPDPVPVAVPVQRTGPGTPRGSGILGGIAAVDTQLERLEARLVAEAGGDPAIEQVVRRYLADSSARFAAARVRQFVPSLVEREVRERLRALDLPTAEASPA